MTSGLNEQRFNIELLQEIEKYPFVYNTTLPEYSRRDITEQAWNNISNKVNAPVSTCKERWKNIRSVFVRKKHQIMQGKKQVSPYYLNKYLKFVVPFIKSLVNLRESPEPETDTSDFNFEVDALEDSLLQDTKPEPSPKRKKLKVEADAAFAEYYDRGKKPEPAPKASGNAREMFLLSLMPEVTEMTEQRFRIFKRRTLRLIDDICGEPVEEAEPAFIRCNPSPDYDNISTP